MSDITDPSGRVIVAPQKPFRDRHRDLISAGIGALIALLGTCAGQVNQYVLTEKQIRQDAAERQQREAVAAFDEVSAAMNAVLRAQRQARTRLTKVSALSRRDLFDTLQSLGQQWLASSPRYYALSYAYFGAKGASNWRKASIVARFTAGAF